MRNMKLLLILTLLSIGAGDAAAQKPYRLPDLGEKFKDRIIWGSQAESPEGFALAFGGQDQVSEDGMGHTRIREKGGDWTTIHEELRKRHHVRGDTLETLMSLHEDSRSGLARLRSMHFRDPPREEIQATIAEIRRSSNRRFILLATIPFGAEHDNESPEEQLWSAAGAYEERYSKAEHEAIKELVEDTLSPTLLRKLDRATNNLGIAYDILAAEPPPRALSPIVYEPKSGLFVLFGGDHFDYLMNDVWVFDPMEKRWSVRIPAKAPRPRANHTLKATGDGKIVMTGGYTYSSNTDYLGGQYVDLDDGEWVYDVEKNTWSGEGPMVASGTRTYRTGPFHPEFYYEPEPDRAAHQKVLDALSANRWVKLNPPNLPRLNRDWGTAVLDGDRDLILRYSGGHSAHGGTDVLHYHIATNRWELCYPVEFPLGQLYANTRYPNGFNFNGRPWITGHTYQNYGYEPRLKKMLFSGRPEYTYIYDVDRGDWGERFKKPAGMIYNSCFYTLTHCATPAGLVCWTKNGELFRFDADAMKWLQLEVKGEKLPGAVVDNSTLVYDSKRNRLLFFVKGYGNDRKYDGQIHAFSIESGEATKLSPDGMAASDAISYLCQIRYDEANDLLLVGATLPPDENGLRRTPAYDPVKNQWVSLKITGEDPSGERGRNVSLGMMYEPRRKLLLAVDTNSQVYALRLAPESANMRPLTD